MRPAADNQNTRLLWLWQGPKKVEERSSVRESACDCVVGSVCELAASEDDLLLICEAGDHLGLQALDCASLDVHDMLKID
jgi:hypothetical protein